MKKQALRLGVNIDHVATLRQQRGTPYPGIVDAAKLCEKAGAHGITVHLREDRRHIQDKDVFDLRKRLSIPLNLEMANSPEIVGIALRVRPAEVCIVPERRQELTTEGGLDAVGHKAALRASIRRLSKAGIAVSLFVDPDPRQLAAAADLEAPYVELHTGAFCDATGKARNSELARLIGGARYAHGLGLKVNAGHGINLDNLGAVMRMPHLDTLNIGHSIICRAVFVGLEEATREMLKAMRGYRSGS